MSSFLFRRTALSSTGVARRAFSTTAQRQIARISIVGNLGDTPELQTTGNGRAFVRYVVASNSGRAENRTASWFRVTDFSPAGPRRDYILSLPKG